MTYLYKTDFEEKVIMYKFVDGINFNVTWKIIERTFDTLGSIKCVLLQLRNGLIILFERKAKRLRLVLGTIISKNRNGKDIVLFLVNQDKS